MRARIRSLTSPWRPTLIDYLMQHLPKSANGAILRTIMVRRQGSSCHSVPYYCRSEVAALAGRHLFGLPRSLCRRLRAFHFNEILKFDSNVRLRNIPVDGANVCTDAGCATWVSIIAAIFFLIHYHQPRIEHHSRRRGAVWLSAKYDEDTCVRLAILGGKG